MQFATDRLVKFASKRLDSTIKDSEARADEIKRKVQYLETSIISTSLADGPTKPEYETATNRPIVQ